MTDDHHPVKPTSLPNTTPSNRRATRAALFVSILAVAGLAGLLVFGGVGCSTDKNTASPLRGSNNNGGARACPTAVPFLDENGFQEPHETLENGLLPIEQTITPPSCTSDQDPLQQAMMYAEWKAPTVGQATLSGWTVLVDVSTCACITTTSTMEVSADQVLRVWTPVDESQPIEFHAIHQEECPETVPKLEASGAVADIQIVATTTPPSCTSPQDPIKGVYYDWQAPATGQATLAAWTVWVETLTCNCQTSTTSTMEVTGGQVYRLWTPLEETQPIEFTSHIQCPKTVAFLQDNGSVDPSLLDNYIDDSVRSPSCASEQDPMPGVYFDWEAPNDGQATLAPWTVLVNGSTCECLTSTSTVNVVAGQIYRVWAPTDERQPIQFVD